MKIKLSAKSIFIILIVLIITILTSNYINRNSQLKAQKIQDIDPSKEGKMNLALECFESLKTRVKLDLEGFQELDIFAH